MKSKRPKPVNTNENKEDKDYFLVTVLVVMGLVIGFSLFLTFVVIPR
jgi:hypothetical protein